MAHSMDNKAAGLPEARLRVARPMYCRPRVCSTPCGLSRFLVASLLLYTDKV